MKKYALFSLISILVLVSLACGTTATPAIVNTSTAAPDQADTAADQPTEPPAVPSATPQPAASPTPSAYAIGDQVVISDIVIMVAGWSELIGNEYNKPDEGKKFVAVDLLIVNAGSTPVTISTLMQMALKDSTSQQYDIDLMASILAGSSPDEIVMPGERIRGQVGFQIPLDAVGLVFVFDASLWNTGKVFINLGDAPAAVEIPASIPGETAQDIVPFGESADFADLEIVINEVTNPPGSEYNQPNAGNVFVIVDLTIENKGSTAVNVSSLLQMSMKDATGQLYDIDLMASVASGGSTIDGEISAGETIRGQAGFQVAEGAAGLLFVFSDPMGNAGKIFFATR